MNLADLILGFLAGVCCWPIGVGMYKRIIASKAKDGTAEFIGGEPYYVISSDDWWMVEHARLAEARGWAPRRVGPIEPDNDMVICPNCTSQFGAIPVNDQRWRNLLEAQCVAAAGIIAFVDGGGWSRQSDDWTRQAREWEANYASRISDRLA